VPEVALILWGVFGLLGIGARVLIQLRTTGSTGVVLIGGTAGPLEWISGALFLGSLVVGVLAPLLQLNDGIGPFAALDGLGAQVTGLVLFAAGLVGMVGSQSAMGRSWRLGVPEERTELVTGGPFGLVRNPIFTAMVVAVVGLALLAPNALSLASIIGLIAGLELHVRFAEEPQLLRSHGEEYAAYASRVGRFVPGLGRLRRPVVAPSSSSFSS
jgi:protein-S-isoprenylcysteine O-methyltransferase Ste14